MPYVSESLSGFDSTLSEVDELVRVADTAEGAASLYAGLTKAAVLLLTGKFETFAEAIAEEYVYAINSLRPRPSAIPQPLLIHHSFKALRRIDHLRSADRHSEAAAMLKEISKVWATEDAYGGINVDCKFVYGKHGEDELRKLFARIGIEDVFASVPVKAQSRSIAKQAVADEADEEPLDFRGVFNSVTNIRNNILHQDASPNLTAKMVREYRVAFHSFATGLCALLENQVRGIAEQCA